MRNYGYAIDKFFLLMIKLNKVFSFYLIFLLYFLLSLHMRNLK